jgi:hypothetical protein
MLWLLECILVIEINRYNKFDLLSRTDARCCLIAAFAFAIVEGVYVFVCEPVLLYEWLTVTRTFRETPERRDRLAGIAHPLMDGRWEEDQYDYLMFA